MSLEQGSYPLGFPVNPWRPPFIDRKVSAHAAYEKVRHTEQNQAGISGYHMLVLPYCSGKSHSHSVLHVMRDSGPRCEALHAILGLSWMRTAFFWVCVCGYVGVWVCLCGYMCHDTLCGDTCVCACMWRPEVNPRSHSSCLELAK